MTFLHGLVIGKFYPPHAGHHHLVRAASAGAERVTVVVMAADVESLALADRVAWMREVHARDENVTIVGVVDNHPVDYGSDDLWTAHVALMREAVASRTTAPIDAVFTSEPYGEELARRFDARHINVDEPRSTVPLSGTLVRADIAKHWDALAPCVRAGLALRVIIVGAESTGKTTLAAELAERLRSLGSAWARVEWVGEVGRDATIAKVDAGGQGATIETITWSTSDFVDIARAQGQAEEAAARRGGPVLVCDTDAFATGIWHERYMGKRDAEVEAIGDQELGVGPAGAYATHLYLLTHHEDVPFVQDGIRDGEHIRAWMMDAFAERLRESGRMWQWLRGSRQARLDRAVDMVQAAYAARRLAAPLG
jgi:HTH-type transcriptional repressor of NAD biosynthesis genes